MSRKKAPKYVGYVRYTVDKAIKAAVEKCKLSEEKVLQVLLSHVANGHKLSFAYDADSDTYNVSLYGHDHNSPYPGVGLSARHQTLVKAMVLLHVLNSEVYAEGWPDQPGDSPDQYTW